MKVRLFVELELSDELLLKQFGAQLPALCASHDIHTGTARHVERLMSSAPGVNRVQAVFLPELLP